MFVSNSKTAEATFLASDYAPMRILEIELGQRLHPICAVDEKTGRSYECALCLVRLHTQPLGTITLDLNKSEMDPAEYVQFIWNSFNVQINEHLRQDGLPLVTELDVAGLCHGSVPLCIVERQQFFTRAPFVSIIVSTRDRPERLQSCLRSLTSLHYPQYEVIIIDNSPTTNATADLIHQTYHDLPWVRYIREDKPGASRARNRGIMAAQGEVLAFTDDDVIVDPYWLIELVRAFNVADDVVCVTGLTLPLELETPPQFWFEDHDGLSARFTSRIYDMAEHHPKTPLYPYTTGQFGTGASMAFKAAFLRSVNGFDPALGPGSRAPAGEELVLFFQVVTRGYKVVYTPSSLLYHLHRRDYTHLHQQIYNYGIGLTAYLTKILLENPFRLFELLAKVPYGLYFCLSSQSPKNSKKSAHYPKELTIVELKGMLYGPFAIYGAGRTEQGFFSEKVRAVKRLLCQWIKDNSSMFLNAGSLVGTTAVTAGLGFVYWWLAARQFPPETVGFASAAVSAMTLLGSISILGLGTLLIGELPRHVGKEISLISAALILVGVVGGGAGIAFALVAPFISNDFQPLRAGIQNILLFAAGVSLMSITLVLDQALIGLLRGELQLWRNTLFAIIKLIALFMVGLWLSHAVGLTIYTTWTIGNVLSLVALAAFVIWKKGWSVRSYLPHWGLLRKLKVAAIEHHMLNMILQAPALALPIIVTIMLSVKANAWFYVAWTITSFVSVGTRSLTTVLYATSSAERDTLAHKARLVLGFAIVICVLANCVLQLGSSQILELFGHAYAEEAAWSLRILSLAAFPFIIKSLYIAICRVEDRLVSAMSLLTVSGLSELVFVAAGARLAGLRGLSVGWLIALCIEVIFMFGTVYKVIRFTSTRQDSSARTTIQLDSLEQNLVMSSMSNMSSSTRNTTQFCPLCKTELPGKARFCGQCGHNLEDPVTLKRASMRHTESPTMKKVAV